MKPQRVQQVSLVVLVLIVSIGMIWVILPYYSGVLWAVVLAVLFHPLHRWMQNQLGIGGNLAAIISVLTCFVLAVIPAVLILFGLAQQATAVYADIASRQIDMVGIFNQIRAVLPDFALDLLAQANLGRAEDITSRVIGILGRVTQFIAARAMSIGQSAAQLTITLGVMLYVLFFLFRDSDKLVHALRMASPLNSAHTRKLMQKFNDVVMATVTGNVIIAVIQGTIGGLAFWIIGIEPALFFGVLMGFLSLLPAVGAFLVWMPFAIYYLLTAQYLNALFLMAVGFLIIGMVDNLLRPPLVGRKSNLPDYLVLVSTLGGISQIGINGFVVGPLIAALFISVWSLFRDEQ